MMIFSLVRSRNKLKESDLDLRLRHQSKLHLLTLTQKIEQGKINCKSQVVPLFLTITKIKVPSVEPRFLAHEERTQKLFIQVLKPTDLCLNVKMAMT
jgi:hypothetical protein